MKIIFISPLGLKTNAEYESDKQIGAVEKQIIGLANSMKNKGHDVIIFRSCNLIQKQKKINGITLINIPINRLKKDYSYRNKYFETPLCVLLNFLYSYKIIKEIKKIKPDIINIPSHILSFFLIFIKYQKFYTTHTHIWPDRKGLIPRLEKVILKKFIKSNGNIIPLNSKIMESLKNANIKTERIIPNGIDISRYKNKKAENYILYSGRLLPHKKVDYLIKAFSKIKNTSNSKLIVVGSGPEKQKLQEIAHDLKNISVKFNDFLPFSEYLNYLSKCSFFVLPSIDEMFGVVIIEAMACGKPVIASNIAGPQDIINHGKNGFLFEKENVRDLQKYLKLLLEDRNLRLKIGQEARNKVEENYSFEKIADSYLDLYCEIGGLRPL